MSGIDPLTMRALIAAAVAFCLAVPPAQAQTAAGAQMTLPAAAMQQLGLQAIEQGRFDLALQIADALIAANPNDTFAYYLKATALYRTNRLPEAQKAAKQSYRTSQSPEQSYQAARLTALAAYNSQHYGTAQWWLRRAAQYAPEEARRDRSIAEFNAVRAKNPMHVELSFSVVPSDNVNSGTSGSFNYIDGVPYVGVLTPDALALPGWIAEASVDLQYRLSATDSGSTFVGLYVFAQDITLSDSAKADLGDYPAPDLGARRAEVSLRHSFAKAGGAQSVTVAGILGIQQEGGVEEQTYARLRLGYARALDTASLFNIAVAAETREAVRKQEFGDQIYTLRGSYVRSLKSADVATATLFASQFVTFYDGQSSVTFGGDFSYDIARDFGPMNLSFAAGAYVSQFDGYTIATIEVPGGRQDTTGYLQVQALFPGVEYSGFAPVLTLQRKVTSSNVSRFDSKETSISLGIQSTF